MMLFQICRGQAAIVAQTIAALTCALGGLLACEESKPAALVQPSASIAASASASATASATATASASAATPPPDRPVPKPETMVSASMPADTQLKAIAYMVWMRAPQSGDASADVSYAEALAKQLTPLVAALGAGAAHEPARAVVTAGGRQLDLLSDQGCDANLPKKLLTQRAAIRLSTLRDHGVLVVRCNDARTQCMQSTRDEADVLCTTAPRKLH